jgi:hypothetical protein
MPRVLLAEGGRRYSTLPPRHEPSGAEATKLSVRRGLCGLARSENSKGRSQRGHLLSTSKMSALHVENTEHFYLNVFRDSGVDLFRPVVGLIAAQRRRARLGAPELLHRRNAGHRISLRTLD